MEEWYHANLVQDGSEPRLTHLTVNTTFLTQVADSLINKGKPSFRGVVAVFLYRFHA